MILIWHLRITKLKISQKRNGISMSTKHSILKSRLSAPMHSLALVMWIKKSCQIKMNIWLAKIWRISNLLLIMKLICLNISKKKDFRVKEFIPKVILIKKMIIENQSNFWIDILYSHKMKLSFSIVFKLTIHFSKNSEMCFWMKHALSISMYRSIRWLMIIKIIINIRIHQIIIR